MARRTASDLYAAARAAGLTAAQAVVATAIALAESSGDDAALGDTNLVTSTWGPSYGAWQVRTLRAETGTGQDRDLAALQSGGLARQARAMVDISGGGTNWSPWSVYSSGAYQRYLGQAQAAAGAPGVQLLGNPAADGSTTDPNDTAGKAVTQAKGILLKLAAGVFGLALLGLGLNTALGIRRRTVAAGDQVRDKGKQAAMMAAL
jgi:hypothetical protein